MSENLPTKNKKKILVVDDEEIILDVSKEMLEMWKYEVKTFLNPIEALSAFRENPDFDLLITDWVMPEMNGRELILEIREIQCGTRLKIIVMSGYSQDEKAFAKAKIDGFLMKPFNLEKLKTKVREVLGAATIEDCSKAEFDHSIPDCVKKLYPEK